METTKPFTITKQQVMLAYTLVKANDGASGVDRITLDEFSKDLKKNLYKIWNRLSSGSYFPPPVKQVAIPKKSGGERKLGIPTVADRIAQMVVKLELEPQLEPHFLGDSYGYRPNKSALQAVEITRKRCWRNNWVLEFDIKGLFDNIPHDLLMKALEKHTTNKWIKLYVKRWLEAQVMLRDGAKEDRNKGTPQGGVISPLLSNLFMHYAFDLWISREYPNNKWCRYADDGLIHCCSEKQALEILAKLRNRMLVCGIELHPEKTKIVLCKDANRRKKYENTQFEFLGFTFRSRMYNKSGSKDMFCSFAPAVSKSSLQAMKGKIKRMYLENRTELTIEDIANRWNNLIRGWINYFCEFGRIEMYKLWRYINLKLVRWMMNKYKQYKGRKIAAAKAVQQIAKTNPSLFVHWKLGMVGSFA